MKRLGKINLTRRRAQAFLTAMHRDRRGSSAVEFSLVALPFILTLLAILQMSVYYMTQSALDAGVIQTADTLVNSFYTTSTPTTPSAATLKSQIAAKAGGLVQAATVLVDLQPFTNLTVAAVAIGTNPPNIGAPRSVLALRAQANVTSFAPGFGSILVVRSSALIRRQGQ